MAAPAAAFTVIPLSDIDPDSPLTTGLFVSIRDNIENVFAQLVGDPVGTPTFTPAAEHDHDGVNSKSVPGADFILVEKKLITGDVTSVSFTGLDGDTDELYKLFGRIVMSTSINSYNLQPNGISANQAHRRVQRFGTGGGSGTGSSLLLALTQGSSEVLVTFEATFWAKKNPNSIAVNRVLQSQYSFFIATGVQTEGPGIAESVWDDDTTNVTSLDIVSSNASDIRDGSTIALYKLRQ